jgi:hypothetical protein
MYRSSWENEIQKDYDDRKASVIWALTDGNDIEKGIASDLMYSDSELKYVTKKGSEIKEKIVTAKANEAVKLAEIGIKLKLLRSEIGVDPEGDDVSGIGDNYKKRYSYKQMYPDNTVNNLTGNVSATNSEDVVKKMREYNNCVYKFHNCQRELKTLGTIVDGIKEKKDYKLHIRIATELGF